MISKEVLKQYIDALKETDKVFDKLNLALQGINADNPSIYLIPEVYPKAVEAILSEILGEHNFDTLMWWIYECNCGETHSHIWEKEDLGKLEPTHTLDTFDKLYQYLEAQV